MDFIQSMQHAIDYMEGHLLEPITYEEVAESVFMSSYHFHRTFSLLTGMTANEYIRNRRLSLAGQELTMSDCKVIDIALKYGYDTPESFTKAFARFHGTTPHSVKQSGAEMKLFNRLLIKIKLEGGMAMDYRIEKREPFTLLAMVKQFTNETITETGNTEIPEFWTQSKANGTFDILNQAGETTDFYGLCAPISKESKCFDYGIGVLYSGTDIPKGFSLWEVKPTEWAVFKCMGEDGQCIGEIWEKIFSEFLSGSDYNILDDTDFELYSEGLPEGCFCEVWIPIQAK